MFVFNRYEAPVFRFCWCSAAARWWHGFVLFSMNADFYWFNETEGIILQHTKRAPATINKLLTPDGGFHTHVSVVRIQSVVNMNIEVCLTCAWQQDHFLCTDFYFYFPFSSVYCARSWHFIEKFLVEVLVTDIRRHQTISLPNSIQWTVFRSSDRSGSTRPQFIFRIYFCVKMENGRN